MNTYHLNAQIWILTLSCLFWSSDTLCAQTSRQTPNLKPYVAEYQNEPGGNCQCEKDCRCQNCQCQSSKNNAVGQSGKAEVDIPSVYRQGDHVQHIDGTASQTADDDYVQVMGPPASDEDKWFISVYVSKDGSCQHCERLLRDWGKESSLQRLAVPGDQKRSWAHFTVYDINDASQAFRREGIKITHVPTIIVQPPRSKIYGDPATVVAQIKGHPDLKDSAKSAEQTALRITQGIKTYLEKLHNDQSRQVIAQAPWDNKPKPKPVAPDVNDVPQYPVLDPHTIPDVEIPPKVVQPQFQLPFDLSFLGGGMSGMLVGLAIPVVLWGAFKMLESVRAKRKESGQPMILNDEQFKELMDLKDVLLAMTKSLKK